MVRQSIETEASMNAVERLDDYASLPAVSDFTEFLPSPLLPSERLDTLQGSLS
jgi:hypothetical protein